MKWVAAAIAFVLLSTATPAIGSFHETIGIIPDRVHVLAMQGTSFNGLHAPDTPILEGYLGERVRFVVGASESHTFHLHGHPWLTDGKIIDTFLVEPQTPLAFDVTAGSIDGQAGDWMYHCHIDQHVEAGMWGIFRVYPFATTVNQFGNTLDIILSRLGEPVEGAQLTLAIDGVPVPVHVEPRGDGEYLVHTQGLPSEGILVVTAVHPDLGTSVARQPLGSTLLPALVGSDHAHSP